MGGVIDSVMNIGQTSGADRANTAINNQAAAAQGAAQASEEELRKAVGFSQEGLDSAMGALNTPEQLRAFSTSLNQQEQGLNRQAKLFDSIDPAVMAASQQALQLLQGEEAKSLEATSN